MGEPQRHLVWPLRNHFMMLKPLVRYMLKDNSYTFSSMDIAPLRSSDRRKLKQRIIHTFSIEPDTGDVLVPESLLSLKFSTHLDEPGVSHPIYVDLLSHILNSSRLFTFLRKEIHCGLILERLPLI